MGTRVRIVIGGAVMVICLAVPAWALFETSKDLSDKARVSLIDAIKTAEQRIIPGTPVEVRLAKGGGRILYKVEIWMRTEKAHAVYVDAENGQVVAVK
jgi:uncharacterized membrane protein YkoI